MEFSIDSLYKVSGMLPELLEHAQDPGEHPPHGEVMSERLVFGPQPALEVGSFAQVFEGHADRCEPGVRPPVVNRRVGRITHVFLLIRVVQSWLLESTGEGHARDITPSGLRNGRRVARPPPVRSPVTTPQHTCRRPLLSEDSAKRRGPASPLCLPR